MTVFLEVLSGVWSTRIAAARKHVLPLLSMREYVPKMVCFARVWEMDVLLILIAVILNFIRGFMQWNFIALMSGSAWFQECLVHHTNRLPNDHQMLCLISECVSESLCVLSWEILDVDPLWERLIELAGLNLDNLM